MTVGATQPFDLLSHLLAEQRTLTAVEQFSELHRSPSQPAQAKYYRDLIPASQPGRGEQFAFQVDLDLCSGCKACVTACHSLNGLDTHESFRDVGLLVGEAASLPIVQHVTTACHHCIDPGCLNACPVNAYEKDAATGIVRHLDDQCFGCQYCTMACPYEVPKYHADKGIVRKCDMCTQRLAVGEAPACVQACPHQAISIQIVSNDDARHAATVSNFLCESPDPAITVPTTRYVGRAAALESLEGGTYQSDQLEHAHVSLVILLVLSQLSVGITAVTALLILLETIEAASLTGRMSFTTAAVVGIIAAASSTLHLGRPQFAFRGFLGFRHSWLSREIVAFGVAVPVTAAAAIAAFAWPDMVPSLAIAAVLCGVAGVFCSAMIYHITHRPWWHVARSLPAFVTWSIGSGAAVTAAVLLAAAPRAPAVATLAIVAASCFMVKAALAVRLPTERSVAGVAQDLAESARRAVEPLRSTWLLTLTGFGTAVYLCASTAFATSPRSALIAAFTGSVFALVAEFSERSSFFRAVVPLRMPGVKRR